MGRTAFSLSAMESPRVLDCELVYAVGFYSADSSPHASCHPYNCMMAGTNLSSQERRLAQCVRAMVTTARVIIHAERAPSSRRARTVVSLLLVSKRITELQ